MSPYREFREVAFRSGDRILHYLCGKVDLATEPEEDLCPHPVLDGAPQALRCGIYLWRRAALSPQRCWRAGWIYVDEVVEGLLRAAVARGIEGCAFDLDSGLLSSIGEIVHHIVSAVGIATSPEFWALQDQSFEQELRIPASY